MAKRKTTDGLSGGERTLQVVMAAVGAVLLLGSLGVVVNSALRQQRPAVVDIVETHRAVVGGRTVVQIEAVNRGDVTASAVTVRGAASASNTVASVTLDYVPGLSRKTATLTFNGDLGRTPLTLEATGWVDP